MFCPECGKKNPDDLRNCQYCDAELVDNSPKSSVNLSKVVSKAKQADYSKVTGAIKNKKKVIIPCLCIIVAFTVFIITGSIMTNPQRIVEKYFEGYVDGDYEKMFSCLSVEESSFISPASLAQYIWTFSSFEPIENVINYSVIEYESLDSSLKKYYEIEYVNDNGTNTYAISLIRTPKKSFIFFDKYVVHLEDSFFDNYSIDVPKGSTVEIDGIELSNSVLSYDGYSETYSVDKLFKGEHSIFVTGNIFGSYQGEFYLSSDDTVRYYDLFNFWGDDEKPKESFGSSIYLDDKALKNQLFTQAQNDLDIFYKGIKENKKFEELSLDFTETDVAAAMISTTRDFYEDSLMSYGEYGSMEISNLSTVKLGGNLSSIFSATIALKYNLDYTYRYSSEAEYITSSSNPRVEITYIYNDGNWELGEMQFYFR